MELSWITNDASCNLVQHSFQSTYKSYQMIEIKSKKDILIKIFNVVQLILLLVIERMLMLQ